MDAICAKDAELALVISTEVDLTTASLASARQGHLVNGSLAAAIFVLKQHQGLTGYGCRQTKLCKLDNFAGDRLLGESGWGMGGGTHLTIEAEVMYLLK